MSVLYIHVGAFPRSTPSPPPENGYIIVFPREKMDIYV